MVAVPDTAATAADMLCFGPPALPDEAPSRGGDDGDPYNGVLEGAITPLSQIPPPETLFSGYQPTSSEAVSFYDGIHKLEDTKQISVQYPHLNDVTNDPEAVAPDNELEINQEKQNSNTSGLSPRGAFTTSPPPPQSEDAPVHEKDCQANDKPRGHVKPRSRSKPRSHSKPSRDRSSHSRTRSRDDKEKKPMLSTTTRHTAIIMDDTVVRLPKITATT